VTQLRFKKKNVPPVAHMAGGEGRPHSGLPVIIIEVTARADHSGPEYCLVSEK
jgi:hypothetical protein